MKTLYKVLISFGIGICFICVGISLGGLDDVYQISFVKNVRWHPHEIQDISLEYDKSIRDLEINLHNAQVEFDTSHDINHIEIEAKQLYNGFEIYQKNQKLVIDQPHYWWFSDYEAAQIKIIIPEDFTFDLTTIEMIAGKVNMNNLHTNDLDITVAAGQLELDGVNCYDFSLDSGLGQTLVYNLKGRGHIDVDLGLGDVYMLLEGNESEYNYNVNVGLGNVRIGHEEFSGIADRSSYNSRGRKTIDVDCGLGSVDIEMEEE